jgi:WD40 repeat protein/tetratricopeptide (TPR) repeat protein
MGVVFKARQVALNRLVALKMVLGADLAAPEQLVRFRYEAELAAQVQHPNVVQVHEVGTCNGQPYLALEWVEGGTLAGWIREHATPPRQAARLVEQLARGVQAAHDKGVIHRDLKPANVLLDAAGTPRITDFGLARSMQSQGLTRTGVILGTPEYMSPEQAVGSTRVGAATDVYSLGAILYEILTGAPPFRGDTALETLQQVLERQPPSLPGNIPRDLQTICRKCLEKKPERRYATAEALAEDLRRFQAGEPIRARRVGELERLGLWARRRPAIAGLLAALVVSLLAGVVVSACLAVVAQRRAEVARGKEEEASQARVRETQARLAADLQAATLSFRAALARAEAGEVAEGMYAWLDVWRQLARAREQEGADTDQVDELCRLIRLELAAWSRQLPVLHQATPLADAPRPGLGRVWMVGPDDRELVTFAAGVLRRWDRASGQPQGPAVRLQGNEEVLDVSPDGQVILTRSSHTGLTCTLRTATGQLIARPLVHPGRGGLRASTFARFGPGGRVVMTSSIREGQHLDVTRAFWDARTGTRLGPVVHLRHGEGSLLLRGAQDRDLLVVFRYQQPTTLGDRRATGDEMSRLSGRRPGEPADRLECWDLRAGRRLEHLPPLTAAAGPRVHAEGKTLLSIQGDGSMSGGVQKNTGGIQWWDLATSRPRGGAWQPRRDAVRTEVTRDGRTLVALGDDQRVRLYDLASGLQRGGDVPLGRIRSADSLGGQAVASADGGETATVAGDGVLRVWRTAEALRQHTAAANPIRPAPPGREPLEFRLSAVARPARAQAGAAPARVLLCRSDLYGRIVDGVSGRPVGQPLRGSLSTPSFGPGGRRALTAPLSRVTGEAPWAHLWDGQTGKLAAVPRLSPTFPYGLAVFSPDEETIALPCVGVTLLLDGAGRVRRRLVQRTVHLCAAFSPDGRRLAAGTGYWGPGDLGPGVQLWDVTTGKALGKFCPLDSLDCRGLHFRDRGRVLLALQADSAGGAPAPEARLSWHDGATGKRLREPLALGEVGARAFSPDGDRLAAAYATREVRQWSCETGQLVGPAMTQPDTVKALCYSPDRRFLAVATHDQAVRLWDAVACQPVGSPLVHRAPILALSFTPDGTHLMSVTGTGFPHLWPVPRPLADDLERAEQWLAVASGQAPAGDRLALLDARTWQERRQSFQRRWPEPDPALNRPLTQEERDRALARDAEETGDRRAEEACLRRLLARRPDDWLSRARLGANRSRAGDLAGAAEAYAAAEKAARDEQRTDLASWYRHRAAVSGLLGEWQLARWYLDRAVPLAAADADVYRERARTHAQLGDAAAVRADLEKAAGCVSGAAQAVGVIEDGAALGVWPVVARVYDRVASELPASDGWVYRHALACLKAGEADAYRRVVARLLARLPRNLDPRQANDSAMACALGPDAVGDWKQPLALIEQVLRRLPPTRTKELGGIRHAFLNTCGAVLYRAGRWQQAVDRLREGLDATGKQGTFHDWVFLAMAHHRLGQHADARAMLERARRMRDAQQPRDAWDAAEQDLLLAEALALVGATKGS